MIIMNRLRRLVTLLLWKMASIAVFITAITVFAAERPPVYQGQMPVITTETLSKRPLTLPKDLPGEKTLVLVAYTRDQQSAIDGWITGLDLKNSNVAWVELPVVGKTGALMRYVISNGMRSGIKEAADRDRTITLYYDGGKFRKAMGFSADAKRIHLAVVDRRGKVLAIAEGTYNNEKSKPLMAALGK
jgi:hypothetical protein